MAEHLVSTTISEQDPGHPPTGSSISAFSAPGRSLWGTGVAARIEVPAPWPDNIALVTDFLAAIESNDDIRTPGSGPVAFGALPFELGIGATFIIPEVLHGSSAEGQRWLTTINGGAVSEESRPGPDNVVGEPGTVTVRAVVDSEDWCGSVEVARKLIRDGVLTKVVLSREIRVETNTPLDAASLFNRLRSMYPASMCFAVQDFVGASPELLVSRIGDVVRAHPMAGTTPRSGDSQVDQRSAASLLASEKNRIEHQITIDMVHDRLLPWCSYLDAEPTPSVVPAGPVQHLATLVEGRLSQPSPSVLDLVAALHPTPAVGGWPVREALEIIGELEPASRGAYAGPTGWVDARGNGAFAVGVRSAQLRGTSSSVFVGVGIVADSDPLLELEETRVKARALLDAMVRV